MSRSSTAVIVVEGVSDRLAVEALAARRGRDLGRDGVDVVALGGATNVARFLATRTVGVRACLCDEREAPAFRRALVRRGLEPSLVQVCVVDLEDELIRALGTAAVEAIVESQGELRSFRTLQKQPAQRTRPHEHQLRRFIGSKGGRKIRYASLLVDALDDDRVPAPLDAVLRQLD